MVSEAAAAGRAPGLHGGRAVQARAGSGGRTAQGGFWTFGSGGPQRIWTDLREDQIINPAPGFEPIFGPLGPTAGPGSSGNGPGSENSVGCTNSQPRRPNLSPIRWHFVFLGPTARVEKYI